MAAGIAHVTARKRMAADFRVVKPPTVQGDFARRYGSASDGEGGKGSEDGGKLHITVITVAPEEKRTSACCLQFHLPTQGQ
jgi:hypothetical protein